MSWIHRVVFGGPCEDVAPALEESYQAYGSEIDCTQAGETGMATVKSERGWSNDQEGVMGNAYLEGKVSWWSRWTERG